jgi:hypothetical protein
MRGRPCDGSVPKKRTWSGNGVREEEVRRSQEERRRLARIEGVWAAAAIGSAKCSTGGVEGRGRLEEVEEFNIGGGENWEIFGGFLNNIYFLVDPFPLLLSPFLSFLKPIVLYIPKMGPICFGFKVYRIGETNYSTHASGDGLIKQNDMVLGGLRVCLLLTNFFILVFLVWVWLVRIERESRIVDVHV